jgi:hypothetical protein
MKGEWISLDFDAKPCKIKRGWRKKNGWELKSYLVYYDGSKFMWVAPPGYLWDGPSYPSDKSPFGKILKKLVGDRKSKGLLASSAHHDQMRTNGSMLMYTCEPANVDLWREELKNSNKKIKKFLSNQPIDKVTLNIRKAAILYWCMLVQWPNENESVGFVKAFRQYLGLILFQPLYRLITPTNEPWEKIMDSKT